MAFIAQSQTLLNPSSQEKFVNPLPVPSVMQPMIPGGTQYEVSMTQFQQYLGLKDINGDSLFTTVWGYNGSYPGPTIEARRNVPITVKWKNELTDSMGIPLPHLFPVDTTLHWAMPTNWPSSGVPLVTHLHGGHVQSASDGNPNAWFTPGFEQTGSYFSQQVYNYPNDQESATVWYHDHVLGITRLNVYAGLAGFYILRDTWEDNLNLPSGNYEIPIAIQDRMFTEDGQLYYPSTPEEPLQPDPSILPEMFGNFILVNGKTWPVLNVEPRKYRFRFLNGSDSRFYNLFFSEPVPFVQIGTDGGFLNAPVTLNQMLLGTGERKDVIIDFSNPALWEKTITLKNGANTPYPDGDEIDTLTTGLIMAFKVNVPLNGADTTVIPTILRPSPIPVFGTPDNTRQLVLMETVDEFYRLKPQLGTSALGALNWGDQITENPILDAVEEWQVINTTPDAHPIHLHMVNFQVLNRQQFNTSLYVPGNPSSLVFLGQPTLPADDEKGWKDTEVMYPGEVTRIRAKFDLEGLYLWHCHILSHEDHEMMRPFYVGTMTPVITATGNTTRFDVEVMPNPVIDQTLIRMEINIDGNYTAEIYNSLGQRIKVLSDSYYKKGIHNLLWNTTGTDKVENGIYFLHITGEAGEKNVKIILNR
ncbi:MAG: hypothetical protein A3F72_08365 [Bacteroidetes bacterium RIFCSPLOWO2_12_FULL_35_15]|nr:MAG: hypothetical protein A3F72_08365 [Bacteroidetes bacterium RIFCSPLOWO2_12_FULL_35_15]